MDLRTDSFTVDFSETPGLNVQCVIGGFVVLSVDPSGSAQRMTGCEHATDVLSCILSYLGSPDLVFQWRPTRPLCQPNRTTCVVARTETLYGDPCYLITYVSPQPPHAQHLATRAEDVVQIVARWLGLSETAAEAYEDLDVSETDDTLGA